MHSMYHHRRGGFRSAKGQKKSNAEKVLARMELEALLAVTKYETDPVYKQNAYALFSISGNFGLRCSEALDLRFPDFDPISFGYFTVRTLKKKASVQDRLYVGRQGQKLLNQLVAGQRRIAGESDYLFDFTSRTARYYFAYFAAKAKISANVSFHALRHTAARMMFDATKDIRIVNAFLRHAPTSTEIYVYPSAEEMTQAIEKKGIVW